MLNEILEMKLLNKKTIAVLFGGVSSEHEVSLVSAKSVIDNIPKDKYDIIMIGITKSGRWLRYRGATDALPNGKWEQDPGNTGAIISPDAKTHGMVETAGNSVTITYLDAVFPVLHGKNGEDGTMQGLLTLSGIPFVGCGTASSAVCMDKAITKSLVENAGIQQAKWACINIDDFNNNMLYNELNEIEEKLGYPVFVKPANAGSSVGITKAADREALIEAIKLAGRHDKKIVIEESVSGQEIEVAVLGNQNPVASVCGEIVPESGFYDYDAKYKNGTSKLYIPAHITKEQSDAVRSTAVKAFSLLGCAGMTRMDFFVTKSGEILLNEPNTIPGFTSISMYPKLFEASGIPYGELLDRLLNLACEGLCQVG